MAKKKEEKGFSAELQAVIDAINTSYGEGSIIKMTESAIAAERVPTGSLILDNLLEGGYPRARIIEIYGDTSLGKSTMALHFMANCPGPKLYIDTEQSMDREYAEALGVDLSNMLISQPETLEEASEILVKFLGKVDSIVFDSIAEALPKKELEEGPSAESIGIKARRMGGLVRSIKGTEHHTTILFTNQIREKIGIAFGNPITTPGGNAMRFGAHVRLELYGRELLKRGEEVYGHKIKVKVVKNKLGKPHVKCEIPLLYDGRGISRETEVLELAIEKGVIEKSGSWISYDGAKLGQGLDNSRLLLIDNPELRLELENKIRGL